MEVKNREIGELTRHEGILGNVSVLGENRKQQERHHPGGGENDTDKRETTANSSLSALAGDSLNNLVSGCDK